MIYDGIWVGRDSRIPNVDGIRKRFVDDMKRLGAPNLRWPGGCFADGYHWRDGIGPASARPRTYNFWEPRMPRGVRATETNHFGVHEFMRLCRLVGAEPYVAANVGSGSPREFHDWVSYCNAPAGTLSLADERARNGDPEPFGVKYWGIGNESWGCGGNMSGGEYATEYRKYVAQVPEYVRPFLVATGPRGHSADGDLAWTEGFFAGLSGGRGLGVRVDGFALHYYTDFRQTAEDGARFDARGWYAVLHKGAQIENVMLEHWRIMERHDPSTAPGSCSTSGGTGTAAAPSWGRRTSSARPSRSGTRSTRPSPSTSSTATRTRWRWPTSRRRSTACTRCSPPSRTGTRGRRSTTRSRCTGPTWGLAWSPMRVQAPELSVEVLAGTAKLAGIHGSASIRDKRLCVTLTNPSLDASVSAAIRLDGGGRVSEGRGRLLTHAEITATNTFDQPDNVILQDLPVEVQGDAARVVIPKHAVVALELRIA